MRKEDKTPEEIQKRYSEIMKQSSMQIFLTPLLVIIFIIGAITESAKIFLIGMAPIVLYMLWFQIVVYKCPKCGHWFNRYQVYRYECKHCGTKFGKK